MSVCDFITECDDYKDEEGCTRLSCDFSDSVCGWNLNDGWKSVSLREIMREKSANKEMYPKDGEMDQRFLFLDPSLENGAYSIRGNGIRRSFYADAEVGVYEGGVHESSVGKSRLVSSSVLHRLNPNCYISFDYFCHIKNCSLQINYNKNQSS